MAEAVQDETKTHYLNAASRVGNGMPSRVKEVRAAGLRAFEQTPLPNTRMEEWRQTNIADINRTAFQSLTQPTQHGLKPEDVEKFFYSDGAWTELVFVDGFFAEGLSRHGALPGGVVAGNLKNAIHGSAQVVEQHLGKYLQDRSAYTALNSAFIQDGAFLFVPRNVAIAAPIHLVFITSNAVKESAAYLRNLFVLEEGAEAQVITSYVSPGISDAKDGRDGDATKYLNNIVDEIALGQNAHLKFYKLVEEGHAGNHLATTEVRHDRDSSFKSFTYTLTGKVVRNQLAVALAGEGASCALTGMYLNDSDRLIDNALAITHSDPHCNSRIAYKGILDGNSHAVFAGKVYVHPEAQQTDSDQLSNNLLLSDAATVDTKPQLEIYADDVKCTHGATVGSFPKELIFYCQTRGIDPETAKGMLTYGFADEIVEEIEIEELKNRLGRYIFEKYSPKF